MSQLAQTMDPYTEAFETRQSSLPGHADKRVRTLRTEAIEAYKELGWPTTSQEAWKYTELKALKGTSFEHATEAAKVSPSQLETYTFPELDAYQAVLVDGILSSELSNLPTEEVTVEALSTVLDERPEAVEGILGQLADATEHTFVALNTALFQDGVFIDVPDNTVLEAPIHVINLTTAGASTPRVSHPRLVIRLGRSAEATVIETYGAIGEGSYFTNPVTEIEAAENATLRHYRLELDSEDAFHIGTQESRQARDANVRTHNISLGGQLTRHDVNSRLEGEGGECLMNGLFNLIGDQHCDNHTRIDHIAPNCESHQLYKGIVDDEARGVFWGRIFVDPEAQQTNADQHNPNLLLSDDALVDSTPQLEIFADDVRCTHGSTFGQLDPEQLFYMETRGIAKATAQAILTFSFAGEVLQSIQLDPVRQRIEDLVLDRLPSGDLARQAMSTGQEDA